jgi:hypothetical protein
MSVDGIKSFVRRYVDELWKKGNTNVWDELCSPEFTVRNLTKDTVPSRDDIKRDVLRLRMNPDYKNIVEEIIVEGDRTVFRWTMGWTEVRKA